MKINELLKHFDIHTNNEETELLKRMSEPKPFLSYTDREQFVIEALIRKALVSKRVDNNTVLVMANDPVQERINTSIKGTSRFTDRYTYSLCKR